MCVVEGLGYGRAVPSPSWLPPQPWLDSCAPLTSGSVSRSAELLERICDQFDVEGASRYVASVSDTWCNIFVWDCTKALGCEVPHFVNGGTGENGCKRLHSREQRANDLRGWFLGEQGKRNGWRQIKREEAGARASLGFPVVAHYTNVKGPGHVAMLLPPRPGELGIFCAQAGRKNHRRAKLDDCFPGLPIEFFTHD